MAVDKGKKSSLRKRVVKIIAVLAFLGVCFAAGGVYLLKSSIVKKDTGLYLHSDVSYQELRDSLIADNRISGEMRFNIVSRLLKLPDRTIKAGKYDLKSGMNSLQVVRIFRNGSFSTINLTFNNVRTLQELAGKLGEQIQVDSTTIVSMLLDKSVANEYGFDDIEFIGMFIPNTYQVYWTISPEGLLDRMHKEYERFWNDSRLRKLDRTGLTQKEVSVMASIVEEETNKSDEMSTIAGVYINRIKKEMPLQADPTVKFALGDMSLKRVRKKHLKIDSPYNTYINRGLPPGPIRMPSIQAIDAVLNYKEHDYYYFCASPDFSGYHVFAKTLSEHNKNASKYAKALNKAGIN